jgi:predicted RNA-binding protein with PUA-like domain
LAELKQFGQGQGPLNQMVLLKRGRLSIQPVSKSEYDFILSLENNAV